MNPIAYRVMRAPGRSLAFAIFGLMSLMNASGTLDHYAGPVVAALVPFALFLALGAIAAYGAWFARDHSESESSWMHRLGLRHVSLAVIVVVCTLASLNEAGLLAAAGFALTAVSLLRIRQDSSTDRPKRSGAVISDAQVAQLI